MNYWRNNIEKHLIRGEKKMYRICINFTLHVSEHNNLRAKVGKILTIYKTRNSIKIVCYV